MGMSDNQFQSYKKRLLRELQRIQKELDDAGETETLEILIKDLEEELTRP